MPNTAPSPPCTVGLVNTEQAIKAEWVAKAQGASRRSRQMCAPTVLSAVDLGGTAASLDSCIKEEGDCPFHQHHLDRVKYGGAKEAAAAPSHQEMSFSSARKVNPLWRTRCWLEECKEKVEEGEIEWWPLIHPLMDRSDVAAYTLEITSHVALDG